MVIKTDKCYIGVEHILLSTISRAFSEKDPFLVPQILSFSVPEMSFQENKILGIKVKG